MSIVEKALSKFQEKRALQTAVPEPREERVRTAPHPAHAPPPPAPLEHIGPRIVVDRARLEELGVLAPAAVQARVADEFRRIKWPLLDAALGRSGEPPARGNVIMVASAMPDEGKTFSAANLALSIVQERDCSVLLVDADTARNRLSQAFGIEKLPGLVDLLSNPGSEFRRLVVETDVPGLRLLSAGQRTSRAPELFASQRMEELFYAFMQHAPAQVVIFDSAPLLATNEAQVLSRLVGQVLVVVRSASTATPALKEALALLDQTKVISLMLNQVERLWNSPGYYGDYYGTKSG
jgi:receptor protein-tyrosine kinase